MSTTTVNPAQKKVNRLGLEVVNYKGSKTTLCAGCGHNSISERIVECFYELGVDPWRVAKFSGIGCSSKSPAYFLGQSHGFNGVHGRMPAIATGALLANRNLVGLGVTGDGDTASIGIGQFMHLLRRNLPLIYIIENNGVYGLTKGQFSATADIGSTLKTGAPNELQPFDCCALALQWGATFVARSFSGDKKQLQTLFKTAIVHNGLSVIDVISPCVTFNDHEGSTKSYSYVQDHDEILQELEFVPSYAEISVEIPEGSVQEVALHDGSRLRIRKLDRSHDPTSRMAALTALEAAEAKGEVLTGVLYLDTSRPTLLDVLNVTNDPLSTLAQSRVRPPREALDQVLQELA
ncbi:MAG: 2-oxoacid:ferredoxin oxidoreductase subunit beta [Acidobacteriia bacterium]|nr:2-oxoacid:ferredoxin oxidoreductase subunit beta [Terriglobia bacterium]MBV8903656.1 2-oxoacid:ferredoxin oxidoreductase subunit beta [Terriglobia bacterium]